MAEEVDLFNITNPTTIGAGDVIDGIVVSARNGGTRVNCLSRIIIKTGGVKYYGATYNHTNTWVYIPDETWLLNPNTGLAWTLADINALQIGVGLTSAEISTRRYPTYSTWMKLVVTFHTPTTTGLINKFNRRHMLPGFGG